MYDFDGETVLVTGGSKGIGKATGRLFLEHGATVILNYHADDEAAEQALSEFEAMEAPGEAHLCKFDVADDEAVESEIEQICDEHGTITRLVNNAGMMNHLGPMMAMETDEWNEVLAVNLDGAFHVAKNVVRQMILNGVSGSIVNIASNAGKMGFAGETHYCASKGGLISMSRALARELGQREIRVNAVLPGYTDTPLVQKDYAPGVTLDDLEEKEFSRVPLGQRMADPEEIAEVIVFVSSDRASYMTGSVVRVDGGRLA